MMDTENTERLLKRLDSWAAVVPEGIYSAAAACIREQQAHIKALEALHHNPPQTRTIGRRIVDLFIPNLSQGGEHE